MQQLSLASPRSRSHPARDYYYRPPRLGPRTETGHCTGSLLSETTTVYTAAKSNTFYAGSCRAVYSLAKGEMSRIGKGRYSIEGGDRPRAQFFPYQKDCDLVFSCQMCRDFSNIQCESKKMSHSNTQHCAVAHEEALDTPQKGLTAGLLAPSNPHHPSRPA